MAKRVVWTGAYLMRCKEGHEYELAYDRWVAMLKNGETRIQCPTCYVNRLDLKTNECA